MVRRQGALPLPWVRPLLLVGRRRQEEQRLQQVGRPLDPLGHFPPPGLGLLVFNFSIGLLVYLVGCELSRKKCLIHDQLMEDKKVKLRSIKGNRLGSNCFLFWRLI